MRTRRCSWPCCRSSGCRSCCRRSRLRRGRRARRRGNRSLGHNFWCGGRRSRTSRHRHHGRSWLCYRRSRNRRGRRFYDRWSNTRLRRCRNCRRPHSCSLRRGILRFFFRLGRRFRLRFRFRDALNLFAHFLRDVRRNRARVGLLFRNAVAGQKINNRLGLYLKLAGQLVDSDLVCVCHALRS